MGKFEKLCNEYRENQRLIEELSAMQEGIKAAILEIMGTEESHTEGAVRATNTTVTASRFDSKGFKAVYPELYTEYSRESQYKRFSVR